MDIKKIGKRILFPHISVMIILIPVATVFLVYSLMFLKPDDPIAITAYLLSFYILLIWSFKAPLLIKTLKNLKNENIYVKLWKEDIRLRVNLSLYGGFFWNAAYSVFQLCLGIWHHTFWFYSLAGYYIFLAFMRFFLIRHTRKHKAGEKMRDELFKYRSCGIVFLLMNITLSLMIFFMVYWDRTFRHHEITTIAMAAYTFTTFTMAIINVVKYRKYNSPVYSASRAISLASACVSMLTLEATMLTTFNNGTLDNFSRKLFLGLSGGVISIFIIIMAIYMIVKSNKNLNILKETQSNGK